MEKEWLKNIKNSRLHNYDFKIYISPHKVTILKDNLSCHQDWIWQSKRFAHHSAIYDTKQKDST